MNPEHDWKIKRETILLVEDEKFVREVAAEVLRAAGYSVWCAANAREAMRIYEERLGEIDLLFTDMKLPGETGLALARKLRQRNPGLRVLLATGYGELMPGHGGSDCLAKPFSGAELLGRVRQMMAEALPGAGVVRSHFVDSSGGLGQTLCV